MLTKTSEQPPDLPSRKFFLAINKGHTCTACHILEVNMTLPGGRSSARQATSMLQSRCGSIHMPLNRTNHSSHTTGQTQSAFA